MSQNSDADYQEGEVGLYSWSSLAPGDDLLYEIEVLAQPFQEAVWSILSAADTYPQVYLQAGDCAASSVDYLRGVPGNCSRVCFDRSTLFLPFNLGPCLGLASAALLIQNGTFSWNHSYGQNALVAREHSLGNLSAWDAAGVFQDVVDCAAASCSQNNISACPERTLRLDGMTFTAEHMDKALDGLRGFCDRVGLQVNSDIAGPGVMTSYLLQISTAMFFWLLVRVLTSWPRVLAWPFFVLFFSLLPPGARDDEGTPDRGLLDPNLSPCPPSYEKQKRQKRDKRDKREEEEEEEKPPGRRRAAWRRATAMQQRLRRLRLHAAAVSTLVEFQEVQAFFVGAIQIATLATFKPTGSSQSDAHSINSFGEAILDSQLVQMLAINGILPILLVQYILQTYDKRWWYSFALLWVTFALSLAVQARRNTLISGFDVLWGVLRLESPVTACGGNANPMVYCNTYDSPAAESIGGEVYVTYAGMFMLSADFLRPRARAWPPLARLTARLAAAAAAAAGWAGHNTSPAWRAAHRTGRRTAWLLWSLLEYVLAGTMAYYLMSLLMIAFTMTGGSNTWGSWSFGQLVSVMVWVPLLFKFIYYNVFGIEEGVGSRLMKEYRVVRDEDPDGGEDGGYADIEIDELQLLHDPAPPSRANTDGRAHDGEEGTAASAPGGLSSHGSLDSLVATAPRALYLDHKASWSSSFGRR